MLHYVCPAEENAVSDHPKACESEGCPLHDHQLVECNCTDGQHAEVKAQYHDQLQV